MTYPQRGTNGHRDYPFPALGPVGCEVALNTRYNFNVSWDFYPEPPGNKPGLYFELLTNLGGGLGYEPRTTSEVVFRLFLSILSDF